MSGYDDPNRPEFTGKRKPKNFARIFASCKGERLSDGKPARECAKCGMVSKKEEVPSLRMHRFQKTVTRLGTGRGALISNPMRCRRAYGYAPAGSVTPRNP